MGQYQRRLNLHDILVEILGSGNVYFQPPESIKLNYPCIIYNKSNLDIQFGDNKPYVKNQRYSITVIDKNPDSDIPNRLSELPMCTFERAYKADNLNHYIFNLYY